MLFLQTLEDTQEFFPIAFLFTTMEKVKGGESHILSEQNKTKKNLSKFEDP